MLKPIGTEYKIDSDKKLGDDGKTSNVYEGVIIKTGEQVAIKVLSSDQHDDIFTRKENNALDLDHENIIKILDVHISKDITIKNFIVMELIPEFAPGKRTLRHLLDNPLSVDEALSIVEGIGQALNYTHSKDILHRDIKPSNILFKIQNNKKIPILIDFGLSKKLSEKSGSTTTSTHGTSQYKAPEQWAEWKGGSEFSGQEMDIYALAAIFFEMVAGQPAFLGITNGEIQQAHFNQVERPTLFKYNYELGKIFDHVLKKALAFHPKNRYTDVTTFITKLKEAYSSANDKNLVLLKENITALEHKNKITEDGIKIYQQKIELMQQKSIKFVKLWFILFFISWLSAMVIQFLPNNSQISDILYGFLIIFTLSSWGCVYLTYRKLIILLLGGDNV